MSPQSSPEMPFDNAFIADPAPLLAKLREERPVHQVLTPDGAQVWLITRYADVREALADPRLSLNKRNSHGTGYRGFSLPPALDANLLNMDPPDHTRLRRLVSKAFTARRIEELREPIQHAADELLDAFRPGHADLVAEFTAPLPVRVISDLLGVPSSGRADFRRWTNTMLAPESPAQAVEAITNMQGFLTDLIARKRAEPADDLLSAMIAARDVEDRLSEDELTSLAFLILLAGYEASVHLIGNAILTLLQHPELRAVGIEELLRYANPNTFAIRRFPLEDITIGGVTIPAGHTVLLALGAANRDPAVFDNPGELDLNRVSNAHLSFGHGIHYCLGAPLGRLQADIAINTLFRRFPGISLAIPAGDLTWQPSFRSHGLRRLPVTW